MCAQGWDRSRLGGENEWMGGGRKREWELVDNFVLE
jgi:hypothetical protein